MVNWMCPWIVICRKLNPKIKFYMHYGKPRGLIISQVLDGRIFKKPKSMDYWLPDVILCYLMLEGNYNCRNSERLACVCTGQMQILRTLSSINNDSNYYYYSNNDDIISNTNNNKLPISFTIILIPNKQNLLQFNIKHTMNCLVGTVIHIWSIWI